MKKIFVSVFAVMIMLLPVATLFAGCSDELYDIEVLSINHGELFCELKQAKKGDKVTLSYEAQDGYYLDYFTVNRKEIEGSEFTMPGRDVVISGIFKPKTYSISYSIDEKTSFVEGSEVIYGYKMGSDKDLPVVEKKGFVFSGWYYIKNGVSYDIEKITEETFGNFNLYPKFDAVEYSIDYVFGEEGWVHENPLKYTLEKGYVELKNAVKDGYEFVSWHMTPDFSDDPVLVIRTSDAVNIVLYAKYNKIEN